LPSQKSVDQLSIIKVTGTAHPDLLFVQVIKMSWIRSGCKSCLRGPSLLPAPVRPDFCAALPSYPSNCHVSSGGLVSFRHPSCKHVQGQRL